METKGRMIENNLGLVGMVARKYMGTGFEYDDLFQVGCIGLMKAVDCFDPSRGFKFSTLAVKIIHREIIRYIRKQKKHENISSLDATLKGTQDLKLQDVLKSDVDVEDETVEIIQYFGYLDNLKVVMFSDTERECMRLRSKGFGQKRISELVGISQGSVSRCLIKAKEKVEAVLEREGFYV